MNVEKIIKEEIEEETGEKLVSFFEHDITNGVHWYYTYGFCTKTIRGFVSGITIFYMPRDRSCQCPIYRTQYNTWISAFLDYESKPGTSLKTALKSYSRFLREHKKGGYKAKHRINPIKYDDCTPTYNKNIKKLKVIPIDKTE